MSQLDRLRDHRADIMELACSYGIRRVRVFGSVARREERPDSDVDFLIQFEPGRSLLDQVGFRQDLEEMLGCRVDVVAEGGISPYLKDRILGEAIPL